MVIDVSVFKANRAFLISVDNFSPQIKQWNQTLNNSKNRVCPVERAGSLDNIFRRWLQNPWKILRPYIKEGMTVLDFGCGPGYFTIAMAQMVGTSGWVIAVDLQEGMLMNTLLFFLYLSEKMIDIQKSIISTINWQRLLQVSAILFVL